MAQYGQRNDYKTRDQGSEPQSQRAKLQILSNGRTDGQSNLWRLKKVDGSNKQAWEKLSFVVTVILFWATPRTELSIL